MKPLVAPQFPSLSFILFLLSDLTQISAINDALLNRASLNHHKAFDHGYKLEKSILVVLSGTERNKNLYIFHLRHWRKAKRD